MIQTPSAEFYHTFVITSSISYGSHLHYVEYLILVSLWPNVNPVRSMYIKSASSGPRIGLGSVDDRS